MIYGYARVSTKGQATDGNSLEAQKEKLLENGVNEKNIYIDSFTGTKMERPQFSKLLKELKKGDTLVVCKLDRFARSVSQASGVLKELIEKGVTINVLNIGILSGDSVNTLLVNILLAFAQFERDMIVERTAEGKAIAKANNPKFKEGRPSTDEAKQQLVIELSETKSISEIVNLTGLSRATVMRIRKKHKEQAERGE